MVTGIVCVCPFRTTVKLAVCPGNVLSPRYDSKSSVSVIRTPLTAIITSPPTVTGEPKIVAWVVPPLSPFCVETLSTSDP